jgi:hypothetical protein
MTEKKMSRDVFSWNPRVSDIPRRDATVTAVDMSGKIFFRLTAL